MIPLFDGPDKRKRSINLGGVSSASSHDDILQTARAYRAERQALKQQRDAATQVQAWWRGCMDQRRTRAELRARFDEDVRSLDAMRCLVMLGRDEERLARWAEAVVEMDEASLLEHAIGSQRDSWIVLVRQIALILLQSVAENPRHERSLHHLRVLSLLLSVSSINQSLPGQGKAICDHVAAYLVGHDYYPLVAKAVVGIPLEQKSSPALPSLVILLTAPLDIFSENSERRRSCIQLTFKHILTIPLLPNRLPIASLTRLSARLPINNFDTIQPNIESFSSSLTQESGLNLLANLLMFSPPRYSTFTPLTLESYLVLLASLLDGLPVNAFEASPEKSATATWLPNARDDSDDSDSEMEEHPSPSTSKTQAIPQPSASKTFSLDSKTRTRMQTLLAQKHMASLLQTTGKYERARSQFFRFILSLCRAWPAQSEKAIHAVFAVTGYGFMREIYRGYVRSAPIGKSDDLSGLTDPSHARHWPSLLVLTYLYNRALLTMGDDEFFSSSSSASTPVSVAVAQRNPLTLDELVAFSRQLMNIAYILYLGEGAAALLEKEVPGAGMTWKAVRELATLCLQGIHARDSRRPFTPPDHWSCSEKINRLIQITYDAYDENILDDQAEQPLPSTSRTQLSSSKSHAATRSAAVLKSIPFAIPFEKRVNIFQRLVFRDRQMQYMAAGGGRPTMFPELARKQVTVRRDNVAADGFDKLGETNLKAPLQIQFIDQFGQEEAGIDGGGLFKEFFTSLCKEVFHADRGLWVSNKKNEVYPSPLLYAKEPHSLAWYRFIGRIVGKALYEGILIDVPFAGFFLAKWLKKQSYLDDLESLDPQLYQGLLFVKHHSGNLEELSLTFTIAEEEFGVAKSVDLVPNGSNIAVTSENRLQYITLVCYHRLTKQIRPQSDAFFQGLSEIIDPKWLRMFNQQELQVLIGGVDAAIDIEDLKSNTVYGGLYDDKEPTIKMFWKVVSEFNQQQKQALLRFVTSCGRPPLLGFKELTPSFSIRDSGSDQGRLPTASTCVNLLKLPRYQSIHTLREKLLKAIHSGAGFDLS